MTMIFLQCFQFDFGPNIFVFQYVKMIVVANNKFGIGSNGTINEFIIVGVLGNDIPLIIGTNPLSFGDIYQLKHHKLGNLR